MNQQHPIAPGHSPSQREALRDALAYPKEQIEEVLRPYLGKAQRMPLDSHEWRNVVAAESAKRKVTTRYWRKRLLGWSEPKRARADRVESTYSRIWSEADLSAIGDPARNQMPHQWRHEGFLLNSAATQKMQLDLAARAVRFLRPASVLEVGSGWGHNLLVLGCQCPDTQVHGVELTTTGVELTRSLTAAADLPESVRAFITEPVRDPSGYRRVTVQQGSAERLPFSDDSFDFVMTRLALEQMESIRETALSEIARVTRRHVLMIESFREENDWGLRRQYAIGSDYFRGAIADLPRYGLEPVFTFCDWPHKITLKPVFVLAEKAGASARPVLQ